MSHRDLLLEIGCEEIPSRFMWETLEQLKEKGAGILDSYRLRHGEIEAYGTPRRMVLLVKNLATVQEEIKEVIRGPSRAHAFNDEGQPTKAALGFAKSVGVTVEQLKVEEYKGTAYMVALRETPGEFTEELLPEIMVSLLKSLRFPRSMYWKSKAVRFIRPVRWLLCLWGEEVVPFDFADISSSRFTRGHRFLAPGPWEIENPAHYFKQLNDAYVVLDPQRRKEIIEEMLKNKALESQGIPLIKQELLDEVTFLVEYPVIIKGEFASKYLELPKEVLSTTMEVHQRYFPVVDSSGKVLPYFLGISNNLYYENTRKGYQKVLQARLEDADFFYREDRKKSLASHVPRLKEMLFHEGLGTLYDKTYRIVELVRRWGDVWQLSKQEIERTARSAELSKADLLTNMVYEFPELQGVMGKEYARLNGEDERVAEAVLEHYYPRFTGDQLPGSWEGILLSLADKMDTLAGSFYAGLQPSGSQDPYALRRQAQGVVNILLEKKVCLSLKQLMEDALKPFLEGGSEEQKRTNGMVEVLESLDEFMKQRIRHIFQEKGLLYDVVEAVLAVPFQYLPSLYDKACRLENSLRNGALEDVLNGYTRVNNLAKKATPHTEVDTDLFQEEAEKQLWEKIQIGQKQLNEALQREDYTQALHVLEGIKPTIDQFFDDVMVMTHEERLRDNRLGILSEAKKMFNLYGEFSLIQSTGANEKNNHS